MNITRSGACALALSASILVGGAARLIGRIRSRQPSDGPGGRVG